MTSFMESLRKGLDRAGFETDKLMRSNRVRGEASRLHGQAREKMQVLGERVVALYTAGSLQTPELAALAREIVELQDRGRRKEEESAAIQAEVWVEPPDATPPLLSQPVALPSTAPVAAVPLAPDPLPAALPYQVPPVPPPRLEDQGTHRMARPTAPDYCPVCGAALRPQAAFCAQCGTRL